MVHKNVYHFFSARLEEICSCRVVKQKYVRRVVAPDGALSESHTFPLHSVHYSYCRCMCSVCHVHHFEHPHLTGEKTWDLGVARLCFHTSATKALDRPSMAMTQHVYQTSGKKLASLFRHATWIILINTYGFCWGEQKKSQRSRKQHPALLWLTWPNSVSTLPCNYFLPAVRDFCCPGSSSD